MKTAAKKMHVRVNGSGSLQDFLDSRVRATDDNRKAVGPAENERQLAKFESAGSLRDGENDEDTRGNLGQFVNQLEVPTTPRVSGRNLVRIFPIVIAHALGERGNRLNQCRRSGATKDAERFHGSIDGNARVNGQKIFQSRGMVRMTVRNDDKIQLGEIHAEGFDVILECRRIVAGVEEYALTVMFDESRKAPVLRDSLVVGKRVVENRNAILGSGVRGNDKQEKSCGERKESANDFHRKPPRK